jgi:hypothetical protein
MTANNNEYQGGEQGPEPSDNDGSTPPAASWAEAVCLQTAHNFESRRAHKTKTRLRSPGRARLAQFMSFNFLNNLICATGSKGFFVDIVCGSVRAEPFIPGRLYADRRPEGVQPTARHCLFVRRRVGTQTAPTCRRLGTVNCAGLRPGVVLENFDHQRDVVGNDHAGPLHAEQPRLVLGLGERAGGVDGDLGVVAFANRGQLPESKRRPPTRCPRKSASCVRSPQWCQNSANRMMIGMGTPSSQRSAPLPKPMTTSIAFRVDR